MVRRALLLCALSSSAAAQVPVPGFELERLSLNAGSQASLVLDTGDLLGARALRVSATGHYEQDPLVLTVNGRRVGAYVSSRFTTHLAAAFSVTDFAELAVQLPIVTLQRGDDLTARGFSPPPPLALGAPLLQGRFGVLQQRHGDPVDLSAAIGLTLPLGSTEALTRDPAPGLGLMLRAGLGRTVGFVRVGAEAGAQLRSVAILSPSSAVVSDEVGSAVLLGVSLTTTNEGPRAELTARGTLPLTRSPPSLEVLGGVRYAFLPQAEHPQLEAYLAGGPGLGHTPGTPSFRVLAGLAWTPVFERRVPAPPASPASPASR